NFEGGYHVVNYFDALQSQGQSLTDGVSSVDYGLAGPYFGVKYVGNV
ncbi:MAG: Lpg1974 family pore-forming outer membrane protein, partial [Legionella sp.]